MASFWLFFKHSNGNFPREADSDIMNRKLILKRSTFIILGANLAHLEIKSYMPATSSLTRCRVRCVTRRPDLPPSTGDTCVNNHNNVLVAYTLSHRHNKSRLEGIRHGTTVTTITTVTIVTTVKLPWLPRLP